MKKVAIIILSLATSVAIAQMGTQVKVKSEKVQNPKTIKTASSLEYTITEKGTGKRPHNGDKLMVNYTGRLTNDSVFDSSLKRGPFSFKLGLGQVIKGWDEAFLLLQEGDKATIKFGPELGYGERVSGPIPANSTLIFDVELISVTESPKPWDVKGKDTVTLPSGLKYMVVQENKKGQKAEVGTKVVLNYSSYLIDGKPLDSSTERGQPITVKLGEKQIIDVLEQGIELMHKGEKFKFYIPYNLAYGEAGHPPLIPPKTDIIFDIELVDIQKVILPTLYDIKGKEPKITASGLKYYEVVKGTSPIKAEAGKTVKVHYSGYLADGKMFDSSVERSEPFQFALGKAQVIAGWEEGVALMHVGDKFRFVIPYYLAYGEGGRPPMIPAKAELTFDVELIEVK
jgi:peptidylprolyl isomerase